MKIILLCSMFLALSMNAYEISERYTLMEDKFRTLDMLTPYGHDFLIDFEVTLNKNITELIDDAKDAADMPTEQEKLDAAVAFLQKHENTEQFIRVKNTLAFPLPSFTAGSFKIVPDFRIRTRASALLGIRKEKMSGAFIASLLGKDDEVPETVQTAIENVSQSDLDNFLAGLDSNNYDLRDFATSQYTNYYGYAPSGSDQAQIAALDDVEIPDTFKNVTSAATSVPRLEAFSMGEVRFGPEFNYSYKNYFGKLNLYGMGRFDYNQSIGAGEIAADENFSQKNNLQTFLMLDYSLGYIYKDYSLEASIEEVKLSTLSDKVEDSGRGLSYGTNPLFRLHADADFKLSIFQFMPFMGLHKRSGYGLSDGLYAGADLGTFVWGKRLGIRLRGMVDNEHFSISPLVKLWLMQVQYTVKIPTKSEIDDVKTSTMHSLNFSMFF